VAGVFTVELCAPERKKLQVQATEVQLPGAAGVFTVLPGHTPLLTTLTPGVMVFYPPQGEAQYVAVSGGFAEIIGDAINVLADTFELGEEIDAERAKAAHDLAEGVLKKPADNRDIARAETAILRSLARLRAHRREGY
jgi:F-type H+-transporting ATPase subunit epsilon